MTFNGVDVIVGQVIMKDVETEADIPKGLKVAIDQL